MDVLEGRWVEKVDGNKYQWTVCMTLKAQASLGLISCRCCDALSLFCVENCIKLFYNDTFMNGSSEAVEDQEIGGFQTGVYVIVTVWDAAFDESSPF